MKNSKIRVAFVKFGGLAAGGTEKYLQTLACTLPKDRFEIDYYYTDGVPLLGNSWKHPDTDPYRKKYMSDKGINLIHIKCEARQDINGPPYPWVKHNFFDLFDALKYDIIQTGRSGYTEYPFNEMKGCLFIDSIHGSGAEGIEKRDNIYKTILLSSTQAIEWIKNGGDSSKIEIIPPLVDFLPSQPSTLRKELGIEKDKFIFGMHQRNCENIFSPTPLSAYSLIENDQNMFVMLGGAHKYRRQATELGIKNIKFLDFTGDVQKIDNFIEGIDLFAHGRADGEMCSAAIIEALFHGKPVVSCPGLNMGHREQIEDCGVLCNTVPEYATVLRKFEIDKEFYNEKAHKSKEKYKTTYALDVAINQYIKIYEEALHAQCA